MWREGEGKPRLHGAWLVQAIFWTTVAIRSHSFARPPGVRDDGTSPIRQNCAAIAARA
jgi:hypothetical protein